MMIPIMSLLTEEEKAVALADGRHGRLSKELAKIAIDRVKALDDAELVQIAAVGGARLLRHCPFHYSDGGVLRGQDDSPPDVVLDDYFAEIAVQEYYRRLKKSSKGE
jgi:hypothetical protein